MRALLLLIILLFLAGPGFGMSTEGCGAGACAECHHISKEETSRLLGDLVDRVNSVDFAEIPGMWVAEVEKGDLKLPIYIDFSKQYLVSGNVLRLSDRTDLTQLRKAQMHKIDVKRIPLADALLIGKATAKIKVIVFTDPQCPFCKKLHGELKEVVRRDPNIAFLVKLFPLIKIHPEAYGIAKSIVCRNSLALLEDSFAGRAVPPANCDTPVVDQNRALAAELGITSTPTLIFPDGVVIPGFKTADAMLALVGENQARVNEK